MLLSFLGAAKTVTGSKYLLKVQNKSILIDCGLFQGYKTLRLRNWEPLPFNPKHIDAVILTHAHIDHSGYLPLLAKHGFNGPIYATAATFDLCSILLPDSGFIQEEDAKRANQYGYSKHQPALPLYTKEDGEKVLKQFKVVNFDKSYKILEHFEITWQPAGHILGASLIQLNISGKQLLFTGDLGRLHDPIMRPPANIAATDYLIVESTYGDRLHEKENPMNLLEKIINETVAKKGSIIIPSFAVGRAQSLLYYISQLKQQQRIPNLPVFLDSPLAVDATEILCKYVAEHKLTTEQCQIACFNTNYVNTAEDSKTMTKKSGSKIIIACSGMLTGGRILHILKAMGSDKRNTILMTGYQAGGTRGARLMAGERDLKIHGEIIHIHADVKMLTNMSAHADYEEMLTWLHGFTQAPKKVFITHGELPAAENLKNLIEAQFGWQCIIPEYLDEITL